MLAQIKKLKVDENKTQPKLDPRVNKELLVDKETMVDPVEARMSSNFEVQTKKNISIYTHNHLMVTNKQKYAKKKYYQI